jgi:hypothetical protein
MIDRDTLGLFLFAVIVIPIACYFQSEKFNECIKTNTKKYCYMNIGK